LVVSKFLAAIDGFFDQDFVSRDGTTWGGSTVCVKASVSSGEGLETYLGRLVKLSKRIPEYLETVSSLGAVIGVDLLR
jgi:hypothetical protein